jgi:hypothetical protein
MKTFMLLIASLGYGSCLAQENDTCSFYTRNALKTFYSTHMWGVTSASDTIYYHNMFSSPDVSKLREMEDWAVAQGFKVNLRIKEEPISKYGHLIIIEKVLQYDGEKIFMQEVQSLAAKRVQLGIDACNGTGMGAGKGSFTRKPKDK